MQTSWSKVTTITRNITLKKQPSTSFQSSVTSELETCQKPSRWNNITLKNKNNPPTHTLNFYMMFLSSSTIACVDQLLTLPTLWETFSSLISWTLVIIRCYAFSKLILKSFLGLPSSAFNLTASPIYFSPPDYILLLLTTSFLLKFQHVTFNFLIFWYCIKAWGNRGILCSSCRVVLMMATYQFHSGGNGSAPPLHSVVFTEWKCRYPG